MPATSLWTNCCDPNWGKRFDGKLFRSSYCELYAATREQAWTLQYQAECLKGDMNRKYIQFIWDMLENWRQCFPAEQWLGCWDDVTYTRKRLMHTNIWLQSLLQIVIVQEHRHRERLELFLIWLKVRATVACSIRFFFFIRGIWLAIFWLRVHTCNPTGTSLRRQLQHHCPPCNGKYIPVRLCQGCFSHAFHHNVLSCLGFDSHTFALLPRSSPLHLALTPQMSPENKGSIASTYSTWYSPTALTCHDWWLPRPIDHPQ